jgi:ribosomal protein L37AE/L43A
VECYEDRFKDRKKEIKTKDNNNITKFNELFGDKYEVLTRKDVRKITQNMYLKIRCKKCNTVFLKKLANVFRLDINEERELCECSKKSKKKNILADSKKGKELLLLEKREHEKKRKRAQRKKQKDKLKALKLEEEKAKREL